MVEEEADLGIQDNVKYSRGSNQSRPPKYSGQGKYSYSSGPQWSRPEHSELSKHMSRSEPLTHTPHTKPHPHPRYAHVCLHACTYSHLCNEFCLLLHYVTPMYCCSCTCISTIPGLAQYHPHKENPLQYSTSYTFPQAMAAPLPAKEVCPCTKPRPYSYRWG